MFCAELSVELRVGPHRALTVRAEARGRCLFFHVRATSVADDASFSGGEGLAAFVVLHQHLRESEADAALEPAENGHESLLCGVVERWGGGDSPRAAT